MLQFAGSSISAVAIGATYAALPDFDCHKIGLFCIRYLREIAWYDDGPSMPLYLPATIINNHHLREMKRGEKPENLLFPDDIFDSRTILIPGFQDWGLAWPQAQGEAGEGRWELWEQTVAVDAACRLMVMETEQLGFSLRRADFGTLLWHWRTGDANHHSSPIPYILYLPHICIIYHTYAYEPFESFVHYYFHSVSDFQLDWREGMEMEVGSQLILREGIIVAGRYEGGGMCLFGGTNLFVSVHSLEYLLVLYLYLGWLGVSNPSY